MMFSKVDEIQHQAALDSFRRRLAIEKSNNFFSEFPMKWKERCGAGRLTRFEFLGRFERLQFQEFDITQKFSFQHFSAFTFHTLRTSK